MTAVMVQTVSLGSALGWWLLAGAVVVAAGCGVVGALANSRIARMTFALVLALMLAAPPIAHGVIYKWDCGDLPWWLCWLLRRW